MEIITGESKTRNVLVSTNCFLGYTFNNSLTIVHNHTALNSITVNSNGSGKKQLWLILRDRKARKTLAEYEC
jgi:hypothetical protein